MGKVVRPSRLSAPCLPRVCAVVGERLGSRSVGGRCEEAVDVAPTTVTVAPVDAHTVGVALPLQNRREQDSVVLLDRDGTESDGRKVVQQLAVLFPEGHQLWKSPETEVVRHHVLHDVVDVGGVTEVDELELDLVDAGTLDREHLRRDVVEKVVVVFRDHLIETLRVVHRNGIENRNGICHYKSPRSVHLHGRCVLLVFLSNAHTNNI